MLGLIDVDDSCIVKGTPQFSVEQHRGGLLCYNCQLQWELLIRLIVDCRACMVRGPMGLMHCSRHACVLWGAHL